MRGARSRSRTAWPRSTSGSPDFLGLADRGTLEVGKAADLVIFDPDSVEPLSLQTLDDIPGGGTRMTKNAQRHPWVLVNGEPVVEQGEPTQPSPARCSVAETIMNVDDMIILSIDDHTVEPPELFDNHVPAKYKDRAPRLVRDENGKEHWEFEGKEFGIVGLNATVSWPKEEWGLNPSALAEMRPAAYLIDERVRDMNRNGVLASMCFPSLPGFSGRRFQEADDKDLALVMLQAYNDWHIDEWCAAHPGRFIPLAIGPDMGHGRDGR